ncbi:MAG: TRAP transporter substrate-binding protein DctP [Smithellaceae bacterium]|nr:TRAP transporter substrate-binding protein DctP [Smithellaceae bacterium]
MNRQKMSLMVVALSVIFLVWSHAHAQVKPVGPPMTIKISHQWPGGTIDKGDFRDRLARIFAKQVGERTGGALKFEIYPASALFKPVPQYDAMLKGALDMSVFPLDYAGGKIPQLDITLMPCLVKDHQQAMRWKDAPIGKDIEKLCEDNGMKIITWAWCGGGMAGKNKPLIRPEDFKGVKIRAAGKMFEKMLYDGAGASISSMPSSDIYFALQTGVLDAAMTSSSSFESFRLYEQVKYYTSPRITTTWFMLEPLVMSMITWRKLSPEQQRIVTEVGKELEKFALEEAIKDDTEVTDLFKYKGVIVYDMTLDDLKIWTEVAKRTAWKDYTDRVKGGKELLEKALEVK